MQKFDPHTILRPELAELSAYAPHAGQFEIRLDANEAPPFLSALAKKKLTDAAAKIDYRLYPDAAQRELRQAIAKAAGVSPANVCAGVGSDELISILLTVATRVKSRAPNPTLLTTTPTFVMYRLSARVRGQRVMEVPLDEHWDLDLEAMKRAAEIAEPNVIFIATPNNPTGNMVSKDRLLALIESAPNSLVVVDEAYIDYAETTHLELLKKYENVAILRTLSKVGFAGLRVGWLLGQKSLVSEIEKARLPYNLPTHSQVLATLALNDLKDEIDAMTRSVVKERERMQTAVSSLSSVEAHPSQANFLWLGMDRPVESIFQGLMKHGILVRSFHGRGGRLERCLRVTVGTPEQNNRFLDAFRNVL